MSAHPASSTPGRRQVPRAAMQPHCRAARPGGNGQFAVIQAMAPPHAVELTPINANDSLEIQTKRIAAFASSLNGGLIVTVGGTAVRRDVVITAAAKSALRRCGLNPRIPRRASALFMRLTMRERSLTRLSRSRLGRQKEFLA